MKTLFILLALLASACGTDDRVTLDSDPELDYYLQWYLKVAPDSGKLNELQGLKFGTPKYGNDGYCELRYTGVGKAHWTTHRFITIKRLPRDGVLAATVMHELAHCLHDFDHVPTEGDNHYHLMSEHIADNSEWWVVNLQIELERLWQ